MRDKIPSFIISDQVSALKAAISDLHREGSLTCSNLIDVWHFLRSVNVKDKALSRKLNNLLYLETEERYHHELG